MSSPIDKFDYSGFVSSMTGTLDKFREGGDEVLMDYADVLEELFSLPEDDFMAYLRDAVDADIDAAGIYLSGLSGIDPELTVIPGILLYMLGRLANDGQPIKLVDYGNAYELDTSSTDEIKDTFVKLAAKIEARSVLEKSRPFTRIMNAKMPENRDDFMVGEDKFQKFTLGTMQVIENTYGYFPIMWNILPELGITRQFFASCYLVGRTEGCDETLAKV